ncbi:hypothetical protein [Terrabacter sp. MAHUQ-38]|uniref:hypothetical protein n=1 Tax=unclassified Terrabacter TaxID=2630222 RepID=UPI00165DB3CA|nr:hypothetical protein [Terrabacter sp. MAHUQ-38]MBC9823145.1 hypothetical protein [Terrabacter sp. MAHUQ-38]
MPDRFDLEDELVALGRALVTDPPRDDLAALVLARLEPLADARTEPAEPAEPAEPVAPVALPVTRQARPTPRRLGWAIAAAVVLVLALIPPVRAAVLELLRIGGVVVREVPSPSSPPATTPSGPGSTTQAPTGPAVSLRRAEQLIGADIETPASLGPPSSVVVAHENRVALLRWDSTSGTTRLDVFVGSLSWGYLKSVWEAVTPTRVAEHDAVWLGSPHLIEWVDRDGRARAEPPRLAGPTLVWVVPSAAGEVTYRLEGPATLNDALRVAESAR